MASNATIAVAIVTDASQATRGLDQTADAVNKVGKEAKTAGDRIEHVGGKAGQATTGLRDMSDAIAMAGFPQFAAGMQVAAVGLESIDGAATLYAATSGVLGKAVGGVSKALNVMKIAILTNPIFIIAAIILGVVAGFVLLYQHCDGFRRIVDAAFRGAMNVISGLWNWIKDHWPLLLAMLTGPIGLAVLFVIKNFDKIKSIISGVIGWIGDAFEKVFDFITAPFRKAMDWIKNHVHFPSLPSWLPGGKSAPGTSVVLSMQRTGAGTRTTAAAGGVVINISAGVGDPHEIARQIRRLLRDDSMRLGRPLALGA